MGLMADAASRALTMGAGGQDNRIITRPDGSYTHIFDNPPTFTREEIAQNTTGTYVFTYWRQQSNRDERLELIIEGIDCATRRSTLHIWPMKRTKPRKYPAAMKKSGEGRTEPGPEVADAQDPRYGRWDFDRFLAWATWQAGGQAQSANKKAPIAGFAWIDGQRGSTRTHARRPTDPSEPTEVGMRAHASVELATRGHNAHWEHGEGGQATYLALWWPTPGGARIICGEPATGTAQAATLTIVPASGLVAKLTASNDVAFSAWESASWDPIEPATT